MKLSTQKNRCHEVIMSNPKGKLTKSKIERLMNFPALREKISSALTKKPIKIDIPGRGKYIHFRLVPPSKFDKQSLRTVPMGTHGTKAVVGCRKGKYDRKKKVCSIGTQRQAVLVPKSKVQKVVDQFIGTVKKEKRKIAANPTLMEVTAHNPGRRKRNIQAPAKRSSSLWPFPSETVLFSKFMRWAEKNLAKHELKRLKSSISMYRKLHGALPETVSRKVVGLGSGQMQRDFVASLGKSPTETYNVPRHSRIKDPGVTYLHEYEDEPDVWVSADGKFIGKALGTARVKDGWIQG